MLRVNTTVVGVVVPTDVAALDDVRASNVRVVRPDHEASPLERATAVWEQARRTKAPSLMHDADPLAWIADAWTRRSDGQGVAGDLEVAVADRRHAWGRCLRESSGRTVVAWSAQDSS